MDGEVGYESPRLPEQRPKDGALSHSNTTRSGSSSTVQPGSSDSELCRLISSAGSLESLAADEEWTPDTEGESYEQMDINRCTEQNDSPAEDAGETSAGEAEGYENETEDYGLVIEKRFQQLYGFKTPDNCCLLDDEWCKWVFQPSANVNLSWSNVQTLDAAAPEQFQEKCFPSAGQATTEKEMARISSCLQITDNKSNGSRHKTSQQLAESDITSAEEMPDNETMQTASQEPVKILHLHEGDDDNIRNAVAKKIVLVENFINPETGTEMPQRVLINNQTVVDGWTVTSDNPSQHQDSVAQFPLHDSQLLDRLNGCLEFTAGTAGHDNIGGRGLLSNEWPIGGELHDQPLKFLCLINELAIMNDFVVNLVDTCPLTDNERFALGIRSDRCTIEEIVSEENTDRRSTPDAQTTSDGAENLTNDPCGKKLTEEEHENCEATRSVARGQNISTPKSSPKQLEEYEQNVSYGGECSSRQEDCTGKPVPPNSKTKILSSKSRNKQTKNNPSPKKEIASIPQITDTEKNRKSRIPRGKGIGLTFTGQPPRHPSRSTVQTTEGMRRHLKTEDSFAHGGGSEAKLLSENSRILCENRKTSQLQLANKEGCDKHETSTRHCSSKSDNHISSTLLNGQESDRSSSPVQETSPVQEKKTNNFKLPPIRQTRHEKDSASNVPPRSLPGIENTQDSLEVHGKKNRDHLKTQHRHHRGHLLADLIAIPTRKQQTSSTALKLPSLSLQPTPAHKRSHPLAMRRPYTPPNRNVLEARAQWPQFYTSHPSDMEKGLPRRMALKDLPSLKKVPGFSYGVYE